MGGTFNGINSPYSRDWAREEFYRKQDEERMETERVERATHWLASRMVGLTFSSLDELRAVVINLAETLYAGKLDDDTARVINRAATSLWLGVVADRLLTVPRITATVRDGRVSFAA